MRIGRRQASLNLQLLLIVPQGLRRLVQLKACVTQFAVSARQVFLGMDVARIGRSPSFRDFQRFLVELRGFGHPPQSEVRVAHIVVAGLQLSLILVIVGIVRRQALRDLQPLLVTSQGFRRLVVPWKASTDFVRLAPTAHLRAGNQITEETNLSSGFLLLCHTGQGPPASASNDYVPPAPYLTVEVPRPRRTLNG